MDIWNDNEWPISLRKKDEEQKLFHKSVSSAFFLLLDGNDQTLPMDTIWELCRLPETRNAQLGGPERVMRDVREEDYGQMLDVIEGLKIGLAFGMENDGTDSDGAQQLITEFAESLVVHEDDFEVPLFRLTERRSTKPS